MRKISNSRALFLLFIILLNLTSINEVRATSSDVPSAAPVTKILTAGRAIATWPSGIPAGEKRPVIVFLPGWGGSGAVNAFVSAENTGLVNQGYALTQAPHGSATLKLKPVKGLINYVPTQPFRPTAVRFFWWEGRTEGPKTIGSSNI
jgi:hypothetical protein